LLTRRADSESSTNGEDCGVHKTATKHGGDRSAETELVLAVEVAALDESAGAERPADRGVASTAKL